MVMILVQKQRYHSGKKELGPMDVSGTKVALALSIPVYTPRIPYRKTGLIINWGCSNIPWLGNAPILNKPQAVANSSDKLKSFSLFSEGLAVPFTTIRDGAKSWLDEGKRVVCRSIINGKGGAGITICREDDELPLVPLYTRYMPKRYEYRLHVFNGSIIHVQQKMKLPPASLAERGILQNNGYIRNVANGYIFSTNYSLENHEEGVWSEMYSKAIKAVELLGLDFGAVDMIVSNKHDTPYVLEVNSAPGIEGTTLLKYVNALSVLEV